MPDQVKGILSPWLRSKRQNVVVPYLTGRVLDYGCGTGELSNFCNEDCYLGVDLDQESIDIARAKHPGFMFSTNISYDEHFDTIILLAVIEHIPQPINLLEELASLLNPNGSLLMTTPNPALEWVHSLGSKIGLFSSEAEEEHETLFTKTSMNKIVKQTSLHITAYKRFLFGANQLFILRNK